MIHDVARLEQLLGKPQLQPLMNRLRDRLRRGGNVLSTITLANPSPDERSAIDHLLARRPSVGDVVSIRPNEVERILQNAHICDSLQDALLHLLGPIVNERANRQSARQKWTQTHEACLAAFADLPAYHEWIDQIWNTGIIRRTSGGEPNEAERLLGHVAVLLRGVPWPLVSIAELATLLTGDSHALDRGLPLTRLCLSAIASQQPPDGGRTASRSLWEWAGVVMDELSAPVLVLNLRADSSSLVGRMLNPLADSGEPCHLSVRLLRSAGAAAFAPLRGQTIYACENPSVMAAAAQRLGSRARPLICTAGQPASAAQFLLASLQQMGCHVLYHGDFDPSGILITNFMVKRFGIRLWRMKTADYLAGLQDGPVLTTSAPAAIWDPSLATTMNARLRAVLEESVLEPLLEDLRS